MQEMDVRARLSGARTWPRTALLVAAAVAVIGLILIQDTGAADERSTPQPGYPAAGAPHSSGQGTLNRVPPVGSLVAGLAARLAQAPDDGPGWLLLARSYEHLGRDEEASRAYLLASSLGQTDASLERRLDIDRTTNFRYIGRLLERTKPGRPREDPGHE